MEPKLWDSNFGCISLHNFLEHLLFDASYIKISLIYMAKYIKNKKINIIKSNSVKELQGKATWKFISTLYNIRWNLLVCNTYNNTFRQKVLYHCIPKTTPVKSGKPNVKDMTKPASIEKIPSLISIKTSKEVNKISKFFKSKKLA